MVSEVARLDSKRADLAEHLGTVYAQRFSDEKSIAKDAVWAEIVGYIQRYVDQNEPVLDVACDRGHFIRHVQARERWATDIRDVRDHLSSETHFVQADGTVMDNHLPEAYFGTVWLSNYLEHLPSVDLVLQQIQAAYTVMKPGGRIIVLQPNIRLTGGKYWDFLDHKTPLTEKSLQEAAEVAGFKTVRVVTRFLPYSTKSRLPQNRKLVRMYLAFPPAWWLLGKQTLYIGERVT